jgi:hypothetical protein
MVLLKYVLYYIWDDLLEVTKVPKSHVEKVRFHGRVLMSPHHTEFALNCDIPFPWEGLYEVGK